MKEFGMYPSNNDTVRRWMAEREAADARLELARTRRPASWNGPAEHAEIEYEICDRRGRYAGWIERRMTDADRRALENELWKALEWTP